MVYRKISKCPLKKNHIHRKRHLLKALELHGHGGGLKNQFYTVFNFKASRFLKKYINRPPPAPLPERKYPQKKRVFF